MKTKTSSLVTLTKILTSLTLISVGITSCSSPYSRKVANLNPSYGPEIEFRGKKHLPSLFCAPSILTTFKGHKAKRNFLAAQYGFAGLSAATALGSIALNYTNKPMNENDDQLGLGQLGGETEQESDSTQTLSSAQYWLIGASLGSAAAASFTWSYLKFCPGISYRSDHAYNKAIKEKLMAVCETKKCTVATEERKTKFYPGPLEDIIVTYQNGVKVSFTVDPNVLEVKMSPLDLAGVENFQERMQKDIFDLLASVGLKPAKFQGPWNSSHLHIGIKESMVDLKHLLNFLKDLRAHPEFQEGLLGHDPVQAIPYTQEFEKNDLEKAIVDLENDLKKNGNRKISNKHFDILKDHMPKRGQAIVFNDRFRTLELRFLRGLQSAEQYVAMARMLKGRIKYLNTVDEIKDWKGKKTSDRSQWPALFRKYLSESGLGDKEFNLLYPHKVDSSPTCLRLLKEINQLTFRKTKKEK